MLQNISLGKDRAKTKIALANVILVANAFIWFLIAFNSLKVLINDVSDANPLIILGANTGAIAIAGLIGTFVVGKFIQHRRFLYLWITSGIILSLLPLVLNANVTQLTILSIVFGAYFGLGMPATMGYSSSFIKVESRAKIGGITFLLLGLTFSLTTILTQSAKSSLFIICIILAAARIISLITLYLMKTMQPSKPKSKETKVTYASILTNRSFILYFVPWLMFTLVNYMTVPIQSSLFKDNPQTYTFLAEVEAIVTAVVAVIGGFVADKMGRKRLSILGFVMMGIGYAIIGFAIILGGPAATIGSSQNLWVAIIAFMVIDGIAWGIFYVLFLFTLWGDLGQDKQSDKFYFLGALPYISGFFMQVLFTDYLFKNPISPDTIFTFASFFLFIAVLPLFYAPETLPEKIMKDRDLKSYIENAKKKAGKKTNKEKSNQEEKQEANGPSETDKNYEDAKKLAEKYY